MNNVIILWTFDLKTNNDLNSHQLTFDWFGLNWIELDPSEFWSLMDRLSGLAICRRATANDVPVTNR